MSDGAPKAKSRYSIHYDRFILAVDNQRKASFTEREAALAAGEQIVRSYPQVRVVVIDQQEGEETILSDRGPGFA